MRIKLILYGLIMLFATLRPYCAYSQVVFTCTSNLPKLGEGFVKSSILWNPHLFSAENQYWDLSNVDVLDNEEQVTCLSSLEEKNEYDLRLGHTKFSYSQDANHLYLAKTENKVTMVIYEQPELQLFYPCAYLDSISSPIRGKVVCGDKEKGDFGGSVALKADATGIVLFPNGIRLDSLLRIHHVKEFCYGNSSVWIDSYRWYSRNIPYPLLEYSETKGDGKLIARSSYYCPTLVAMVNDCVKSAEQPHSNKAKGKSFSFSTLPHDEPCYVTNIGNGKAYVMFGLQKKGEVEYSLCLANGIVVFHKNLGILAAGYHEEKIPLPSTNGEGVYILSYVVNGVKGSTKIVAHEK